jgi:thiol-disulfide isomerase/thioredoxin
MFFAGKSYSQQVKSVKITDVADYIKKSDHPLVVAFWATWCGPCVEEIPWLQDAIKKYADHKVELVLVSLDFPRDYPTKVNDFVKSRKFDATLFWLNETKADYFCPKIDTSWDGSIPSSLYVNHKTGYRRFFNRQLTDRQVDPELKELLKND